MYVRDIALTTGLLEKRAGTKAALARLERFQRATFCVTDLFLKLLARRVDTGSIAKVIIEFDDTIATADEPGIREGPPILWISWPLSLSGFDSMPADQKKRFILDLHIHALRWLAKIKGWNVELFDDTYQRVLEQNLIHTGFLMKGKKVTNPAGTMGAKLFFDFDVEAITVIAIFLDNKKAEIARKVVLHEKPFDYPWPFLPEKAKWISNRTLVLKSRADATWRCRLDEKDTH